MLAKKTFIAIEAVMYIACHASDKPVRSKDICQYQGVTLRYLEQVMQQLVRDNILKGVRGPKGGYLLARDRRKILLSEIYESVRKINDSDHYSQMSELCKEVVSPLKETLRNQLCDSLGKMSLLDLYDTARNKKIDLLAQQASDFII